MRVESISGEPAINLATCTARLRKPISCYQRSRVLNMINPERDPDVVSISQPLNPFLKLTEKMTGPEEWKFITQLDTILVNDGPKPVIYALIPKTLIDRMPDGQLFAMMNSLASNDDIKKHILETHGYTNGLVEFIPDDGGTNKLGIDWQYFENLSGEKPNSHKFVLLGAADNNELTPKSVRFSIQSAESLQERNALEQALLASDTREFRLNNGQRRFLFSLHPDLQNDFPIEMGQLQGDLNGELFLDQVDNPKTETIEGMEAGTIPVPREGSLLSESLLSRACPAQVADARNYIFHPTAQKYYDSREYGNVVDCNEISETMNRRNILGYNSPFPVKPRPTSTVVRA